MSTGLELADFEKRVSIWKPAPKGYRSALRRSRDLDKMSMDADDKNGVVVDVLPLKKRRFSPFNSPPSMTRSQENEETEFEIDRKQRSRSADKESRKKRSGKIAEDDYRKFDYSEDFSGIEILAAAAACDNIIDDEEDMTRQGVDSSASAVLFEENAASGKDLASEDKKETSSLPSRLHWDLNALMDAWEQPCDDTFQDDSHTDVVDNDLMAGKGKTELKDKCKGTLIGIVHDAKSSSTSSSQIEESCATRSTTEVNRDTQVSGPCGKISSYDTQLEKVPCAVKVKNEQSNEDFVFREDSNKANCEGTLIGSQNEEACITHSTIEVNREAQISDRAWRPCGKISSSDTQLEKVPSAVKVKNEQSNEDFVFREDSNKANCEGTLMGSQNEEVCITRSTTEVNMDAQCSDRALRPFGKISSSDTQLEKVPFPVKVKNEQSNGDFVFREDSNKAKCEGTLIGVVKDAKSSSHNEEASLTRSTTEVNMDSRPCGEICSSDTQLEKVPCAVKVKNEQSNGDFVFREDSNKANCEIACSVSSDVENPCRASGGDEDKQLVQDMRESISHAPLEAEHANQARSAGSASEGQSVVSLGAKQPPNQVSSFENRSDSEHVKVEKLMEKACVESIDDRREGSSKVTHDPSDDSYESGVYQDDKMRNFGRINSAEIQAGHDSQIEDGELRGSDACHWDENDDGNREDELLDYGSESDEDRHCSIDKAKDRRIENCGTSDPTKDESDSPKTRTSDATTDKDFLSEGVGSRTLNKEEGSILMHRKDAMMRSRYDHGGSTHSQDEMGSVKETHTRLSSRSPGGWDSERRYSNSYLGGYANGPRGMKSMEDHGYAPYDRDIGTRRFARFDNHVRGQFVNHSSNRRFEHSNGTRSSSNCMNRLYVRDNSPTSNSFRRSSQDRGGFYKTAPEDSSTYQSNRLAHRLGMPRRERSISPVGRGVRGFARFDNNVREQFPNRSLNSRFEHCNGRSSANGRLYVRDRDNSPTSTSFRRSPERGGFYKPVMEDNSAYPNRLAHRMGGGMPRRERSISPVGRGTRGYARFENHVRGQFVNRSSNSRFEHSNGTRYSATGMNRLYARDSSPSISFRRSPQAFDRGERGGFYKPALEGMPRRERSISPRGRPYHPESRSRGRAPYVSAGEQIEGSRLRGLQMSSQMVEWIG